MRLVPRSIEGAFVIEGEPHWDARGSFARAFCAETFAARGLDARVAQTSVSRTSRRGTIRGMHLQRAPHEEAKLVRCLGGEVWDVLLDLREGSPTFGRWEAVVLDAARERAVYIPPGVAHGFQALTDDAILYYQMSVPHAPEAAWGVRYDDPEFGIDWPIAKAILSPKDRELPRYRELFPVPVARVA